MLSYAGNASLGSLYGGWDVVLGIGLDINNLPPPPGPGPNVPEPATLVLLVLGATAVCGRRRR